MERGVGQGITGSVNNNNTLHIREGLNMTGTNIFFLNHLKDALRLTLGLGCVNQTQLISWKVKGKKKVIWGVKKMGIYLDSHSSKLLTLKSVYNVDSSKIPISHWMARAAPDPKACPFGYLENSPVSNNVGLNVSFLNSLTSIWRTCYL
jgi:hypothetical protein